MTTMQDAVWSETDEHSPFTEAARARAALSAEARSLADFARGFVTVHGPADDGHVEDAARLVAQAEHLLSVAVVAARAAGTSWEDIGTALGITRQSAHNRFIEAERHWKDVLAHPEGTNTDGLRYSRLPHGADDTAAVAADLDAWVIRHRERTDVLGAHPDAPVSGNLRRMGPLDEDLHLSVRLRALLDEQPLSLPVDELIAIYERQAVLAERLAAGGVEPAGNREHAARARARAAELRAGLGG